MPASTFARTPTAAPSVDPRPETPRPHANAATAPRLLRAATAMSTAHATMSNSVLPVDSSSTVAVLERGRSMVMAKKPATINSTDTCTSKSAGKRFSDSNAQTATIATGRITKNEDSGTPPTSPKRNEQPNATRNRNRHTNSWLASGKNDDGRVTEKSCGASPACVCSSTGRASRHDRAHAAKGAAKKNAIPAHTGSSQANADVAPCTTNASGTSTPAWAEDSRDAAMPAVRTHQARPTANAHDVSTSNDALPNPSANGRAQPAAIRARAPAFRARTCKSAGRKVASKPMAMRIAALAVMDMSRAYVKTPSKAGNTDTFMNDETESTSDSAANERQNAGVNKSRTLARPASVCTSAAFSWTFTAWPSPYVIFFVMHPILACCDSHPLVAGSPSYLATALVATRQRRTHRQRESAAHPKVHGTP